MVGMVSVLATMLQVAAIPASVPASPIDEKVCRRIEVTGSIIRKERVCKSKAEWRRLTDLGNVAARAIVTHSAGRPFDMQ